MSSYSASVATRRGSIVPPLAGVERPVVDRAPESCDVLITGTGLIESILSAALAWQGTNVLHIDDNSFYGDYNACLNIDQLQEWVIEVNRKTRDTFANAKLYIPRPLDSRKYLIDLTPTILFARSDILDLLIKSRVFQYLEFKSLGSFHTYEKDSFEKVPGTKEDIFTNQSLSLMTKRSLMRFMKFALEWEAHPEVYSAHASAPIGEFLQSQFKLDEQQVTELVVSIGLCSSLDIPVTQGLARIKRYLVSLDIYGNFPVLYSMYGSAGELAQGFSRSAAVAGATYKLETKIDSYDSKTKTALLSDGSKVQVSEKVVTRDLPESAYSKPKKYEVVTRLTAVVAKDCKEWFAENENAAIVAFPPKSLSSNNNKALQAIIMGPGTGACPDGHAVWYLSTTEQDLSQAEYDLEEALEKLEASILRESTENFEVDAVTESDVLYKDGMPILSSVKIGESIQNFVPREKLQYLLKLRYQQTVAASFEVQDAAASDSSSVLYAPIGLGEISYDGVITIAKRLYEKIVGSDDDFFDVDFEDEDAKNGNTGGSSMDVDDAPAHHDEIGEEMEL